MASAREGDSHEGGLGAGGKFRKKPFRRSAHAKPYDRPLPNLLGGQNSGSSGWISKLVDPAQRLITASAYRLFGSIFRKRLPPAPPPQEASKDTGDEHKEGDPLPRRAHEVMNEGDSGNGNSDGSGIPDLEQILKQKKFTRIEVDRLTALLLSRTAEMPSGEEEKGSEVVPSKSEVPREGKSRFEGTPMPVQANGGQSLVMTPVVSRSVLEEDLASPTEIAKAYMGSRTSNVSPLGSRSQAIRGDSSLLGNRHVAQKSPIMSIVPKSGGTSSFSNNSSINPRSRGRSAIHSMARIPYARMNSICAPKDAVIPVDVKVGASSSSLSLSPWEQKRISAFKQGSLKRRGLELEDDRGSAGPCRRIRQKPNLLSSQFLTQPASASSLSAPRYTNVADATQYHSSSTQKLEEPKYKMSLENGDNGVRVTNFAPVPTKSTETASKILQQLDKLVAPKEKASPTILSPSMLSGKALRSLENVDLSKFLENTQDIKKVDQLKAELPALQNSACQKPDKIEDNELKKSLGPSDGATASVNDIGASVSVKDTMPSSKFVDNAVTNSVAYRPQKKRAFRMSAPEDFLELDDESLPNGVVSSAPAKDKEQLKLSESESKNISTEVITPGQPPAVSDVKPPPSFNTGIPDGTVASEKSAGFTFPSTLSTSAPTVSFSQQGLTSDKASLRNETNDTKPISSFGGKVASSEQSNMVSSSPIFSFGDKVSPPKVSPIFSFGEKHSHSTEGNTTSSTISFGSKSVDKTPDLALSLPSVSEFSSPKVDVLATPKSESSNGFATTVAGATMAKDPASEKPDDKSSILGTSKTAFSPSASISTSTAGIFSFGASANGSLATSSFSSPISSVTSQTTVSSFAFPASANAAPGSSTAAPIFSSSNSPFSSGVSTSSSSPILKFGSSTGPSALSSTVATSGAESGDKAKHGTGIGNSSGSLVGTTPAVANSGSSMFGFNAPATSSAVNNSSQGSTLSSGIGVLTSTPSTSQAIATGSGVAASTQSMPIQIGSSASSPAFGLGASSASTTSSPLLVSSASATSLFNAGSTFGQSSLASSSEPTSVSSSCTSTDTRSANLQPGKSPIFGSTLSANGLSFGASCTSGGTSHAAPVFGSSNGSSSSSSFFSFTASTPSNSIQPAFGSVPALSQPTFGISSAPSLPAFGSSSASSQPAFGSSTSSSQPVFGSSTSSSQPVFGSSATSSQPAFGMLASSQPAFGASVLPRPAFGTSASSQPAFGSASSSAQSIFGTSTASSQPTFGSSSAPAQPTFGSATASTQPAFGIASASSHPVFGNASVSSEPAFGNPNPGFAFGSASSGNNDQMSMEDSIAEDTAQASTPTPAPGPSVFGQPFVSLQPSSGFVFGSTAPSGPSPFQFGGQQNPAMPQNPSPYQASGSLDFQAGGSFSLGSGGGDKSKRKIIKVKHNRVRK